MHFCFLIFTKDEPSYDELEKIMEPYCEYGDWFEESTHSENYPLFSWDYFGIGGRWNDLLETSNGNTSSAKVTNVLNFDDLVTFGAIDIDGSVIVKEFFDYRKFLWKTYDDYLKLFDEMKKRNKNNWVTVIDIHY